MANKTILAHERLSIVGVGRLFSIIHEELANRLKILGPSRWSMRMDPSLWPSMEKSITIESYGSISNTPMTSRLTPTVKS